MDKVNFVFHTYIAYMHSKNVLSYFSHYHNYQYNEVVFSSLFHTDRMILRLSSTQTCTGQNGPPIYIIIGP